MEMLPQKVQTVSAWAQPQPAAAAAPSASSSPQVDYFDMAPL